MTKICTEKEIDTICKDLKQGKVVGFPTETVYGLAILADSKKAFDELVQLKKRPINKPMTVMVAKKEKIHDYALVNQKQQKIIDTFTGCHSAVRIMAACCFKEKTGQNQKSAPFFS